MTLQSASSCIEYWSESLHDRAFKQQPWLFTENPSRMSYYLPKDVDMNFCGISEGSSQQDSMSKISSDSFFNHRNILTSLRVPPYPSPPPKRREDISLDTIERGEVDLLPPPYALRSRGINNDLLDQDSPNSLQRLHSTWLLSIILCSFFLLVLMMVVPEILMKQSLFQLIWKIWNRPRCMMVDRGRTLGGVAGW